MEHEETDADTAWDLPPHVAPIHDEQVVVTRVEGALGELTDEARTRVVRDLYLRYGFGR